MKIANVSYFCKRSLGHINTRREALISVCAQKEEERRRRRAFFSVRAAGKGVFSSSRAWLCVLSTSSSSSSNQRDGFECYEWKRRGRDYD